MTTHETKIIAAKACNRDVKSGLPSPGQNCADVVNVSVFFDGTGNNKDVDGPLKKWSNPARLWRAAQIMQADDAANYPIYVSGIGTPFNGVATDWIDRANIAIEDAFPGGTFGAGGTRRTKFGESNVNAALRQVLEQNAKKLNISLKPYLKKGETENISELAGALSSHGLILVLNLSIFGFSRGAALARAFSNDIAKQFVLNKEGESTYHGVPVRLNFMGLFDTVASFGIPSKNADLPFNEKNLIVPPCVEQCIHYVAAHELRFSFPVDLIRQQGKVGSSRVDLQACKLEYSIVSPK